MDLPRHPRGGSRGRAVCTGRVRAGQHEFLDQDRRRQRERPLAEAIAAYLELPLANAWSGASPTWRSSSSCRENVRGEDVFIVQSTSFRRTTT